jgi:alkanesulfonate monooxygenase SsuD/methylene tetrahydromethanopterin reductase-like flavin-dependent oxidoreductase (luciferase family)
MTNGATNEATNGLRFGWLSPVIGNRWSDHRPIVMFQEQHILPTALAHFDSLWIADHFYGFDAKTDPFMEGWTTLTWLAAKFPDVLLCHHVLGHGYRPPALTAKMASTLQTLSGGRFVLGIGAGWREDEYRAYGYDFPRPAVRFAQLEEVVEICRLMWTDPDPSYEGRYFQIDGAAASPLPEVVPPICIGASGPQIGLPLAGRLADIWNGTSRGTDDDWLRRVEIVQGAASAAGRDPAEIEVSTTLERALPEDDAQANELLEFLRHKAELGVQHFVMDFGHPQTTEPVLRFVEQVMAPLRAEYGG